MNKDNKRVFMMVPYEYILFRGGQRKMCLTFDNVEELRAELSRYFTPKELKSGIVERLTTFNENRMKYNSVKNVYQNFDVLCNYEEKEVLIYDRGTAEREKKLGFFDVCSPQECADTFGKPVKDGEKIYFPVERHKALEEQIDKATARVEKPFADLKNSEPEL